MTSIHLVLICIINANYFVGVLANVPFPKDFNSEAASVCVPGMRQEHLPLLVSPPQSSHHPSHPLDYNQGGIPLLESVGSRESLKFASSRQRNIRASLSVHFSRRKARASKTACNQNASTRSRNTLVGAHDEIPNSQDLVEISFSPHSKAPNSQIIYSPQTGKRGKDSYKTEEKDEAFEQTWDFPIPKCGNESQEDFKIFYALMDTFSYYNAESPQKYFPKSLKHSSLGNKSIALSMRIANILENLPGFDVPIIAPLDILQLLFCRMEVLNSRILEILGFNCEVQTIKAEEEFFFGFLREQFRISDFEKTSNYNEFSTLNFPHPLIKDYLLYKNSGKTRVKPTERAKPRDISDQSVFAARITVYFLREYYKTKSSKKFRKLMGGNEGFFLFLKKLKYRIYNRSHSDLKLTLSPMLHRQKLLPWDNQFRFEEIESKNVKRVFTQFVQRKRSKLGVNEDKN
ncbi:hypothetical protein O181_036796 [Austropuccinia psidii MF-1]|uniref:Uncharacterized protein n=1 Tax=Austropuccinia psidii MF-1 TaxID=1389203 RepID=A0A9Q3HA78_9BASI|nr:hypothetical protein [Austropuccinia psidii MF-1]